MKKHHRKNRAAFTLIEALAGSVIMGIAVVALCALSMRSMSRTGFNRNYELAWQVLDRELTMIDNMGIDKFNEQGEKAGEVDKFGTLFQWEVETLPKTEDNLFRVNITVRWAGQDRPHQISASTMLNGEGPLAMVFGTAD